MTKAKHSAAAEHIIATLRNEGWTETIRVIETDGVEVVLVRTVSRGPQGGRYPGWYAFPVHDRQWVREYIGLPAKRAAELVAEYWRA